MKKLLYFLLCCCIIFVLINLSSSNTTKIKYNVIISEKKSPDGKYKAVKFNRNINSTTAESFHLSIFKAESSFNDKIGNIYISYDNFDYEWTHNTLIIYVNESTEPFKQNYSYDNLIIKYEIQAK